MAGNNNLNYTYLNNRITNYGYTYDADGRNLTTGYPDAATSTYNAAGQMVHSVSVSTDAFRYYDGTGSEVKRVTSDYDSVPVISIPKWRRETGRLLLQIFSISAEHSYKDHELHRRSHESIPIPLR